MSRIVLVLCRNVNYMSTCVAMLAERRTNGLDVAGLLPKASSDSIRYVLLNNSPNI